MSLDLCIRALQIFQESQAERTELLPNIADELREVPSVTARRVGGLLSPCPKVNNRAASTSLLDNRSLAYAEMTSPSDVTVILQ
jgi:hypothetical protein